MDRIVRDGIPLRKLARIIHEAHGAIKKAHHLCARRRGARDDE